MPFPFAAAAIPWIIGGVATAAGVAGTAAAVKGAMNMKDASDTMDLAKKIHEESKENLENQNNKTLSSLDKLGTKEAEVLSSFDEFSDIMEKIQNRPDFASLCLDKELPTCPLEELKEVGIGAGVLLGTLSGAGLGVAGGLAASGAVTAATMSLGVAGTGAAISGLSGVAATNAMLAVLGGGTLAAGGGGMALGTAILGGATLGVGLLVGGALFALTGSKMSEKADDAYRQAQRAEEASEKACTKLKVIEKTADSYLASLIYVNSIYMAYFERFSHIVNVHGKTNWLEFSYEERKITENTVLLVGLLFNMCKLQLVQKKEADQDEVPDVNEADVQKMQEKAKETIDGLNAAA